MASLTFDGYAIVLICASPAEAAAARDMLRDTRTLPPQLYILGELNGKPLVITCLPNSVYGTVSVAAVISDMRLNFPRLQHGLVVRIRSGVSNRGSDSHLGEVVVNRRSGQNGGFILYGFGKVAQEGQFELTGISNQLPRALLMHSGRHKVQITSHMSTNPKIMSDLSKRRHNMGKRFPPIPNVAEDTVNFLSEDFGVLGPSKDTQKIVLTTRLIPLKSIQNWNPLAADYLYYMTSVNPRSIPRSIFPQIVETQTLAALGFVDAYSFNNVRRIQKLADRKQRASPNNRQLTTESVAFANVPLSYHIPDMDKEVELQKKEDKIAISHPLHYIRDISDYSSFRKSKEWQPYAARTAAAFAKSLPPRVPHPFVPMLSEHTEKTVEDETPSKRKNEHTITKRNPWLLKKNEFLTRHLAFEMEAGGLASHIPTTLTRGIYDYRYANLIKSRVWQKNFLKGATKLEEEPRIHFRGINGLPHWSTPATHIFSSSENREDRAFSMPSFNARSDFYRAATVYLINHFANDVELLSLYKEAVRQMNEASFIKNHQHLLKIYYLELEFKNEDPFQRQAIMLLRGHRERYALSRQIYHAVKSLNTPNEGGKRPLLDQDEKQLRLLNMLLERIDGNSAGSQTITNNSTESEWYTESEGSDSDEDVTGSSLALPELESKAQFLCEGRPYQQYKEQLRNLVCHKARKHDRKSPFKGTPAQPKVRIPDVLDNVDSKQHTVAANMESQPTYRWKFLDQTVQLLQKINSLPRQQPWYSFSWLRRLLRPKLKAGYYRIEWQCDCGVHLHADFPPGNSEPINNLACSLQNGGRSQRGLHASNGNHTMPSQHTPGYNSHTNSQPQISAAQNLVQQTAPVSVRPKFLALCINTGSIYKTLVEIDASDIASDATAFLRMKKMYLQTRSRLSHLNFLVKPVTVEFVRFTLWNLRGGYISVCDRPDRIPPGDSSDYEYVPKPLEPPIPMPPEVFIHYLQHDEGDLNHARNNWFNRLPKRLDKRVIDGDEGTYGWGIHIIEGPNREVIFWIIMITIFGSMLASILWSALYNDIQGGTGLGTMIVALPPAILTAFLFRMGAT